MLLFPLLKKKISIDFNDFLYSKQKQKKQKWRNKKKYTPLQTCFRISFLSFYMQFP